MLSDLANWVKEQRKKKGMSLQDVADAAETSKSQVWMLESGRNKNPSIEYASRVTNALGKKLSSALKDIEL